MRDFRLAFRMMREVYKVANILVCDDDKDIVEAIGIYLEQEGYTVIKAYDGVEAINVLRSQPVDLLIIDIMMPKLDGIEMLRELRRRGCRAHAIILTAYSDFEYARSALQLDADDYLLKPFQDNELILAVERIRQKEQEQGELSVIDTLALEKGDKSRYVLKALEYISEHYADGGINITEIAQHLGVSEGHLSHVFKKETNYTVVGYLTRYRIHMALKLLRDRWKESR